MVTILKKASEQYRREQFLKKVNAEFDLLKKDRKAWRHELQERAAWDSSLSDGLEERERQRAEKCGLAKVKCKG
jgi:hypothetical protein